MIRTSPCTLCKHFHDESSRAHRTCAAFPDGIPYTILIGAVLHDDPIDGDRGLQYQPLPERAHLRPTKLKSAASG